MPAAPGRKGWPRRRRGLYPSAAAAAAVVVVVASLIGSSQGRSAHSLPLRSVTAASTASAAAPSAAGVPTFGTGEAVDYDDVGDPYVLTVPGGVPGDRTAHYVLFWTTDWRSNVPTAVSTDHVHWHRVADSLPVLPSWAVDSRTMTWAPSAQAAPGGWDLYFSTLDAANHDECIGAAFSTSPIGPYVDRDRTPLVCQAGIGGSIDPSVVHLGGGASALVWKSNGNADGHTVSLWEQRLAPSGLALSGPRHRLLSADQRWEHGNIEGPSMLAATKGGWWLFYTGGSWTSDTYDTAVAWCRTVTGPCAPATDGPLLTGTPTAVSPGGLDTFVGLNGRLWASYSVFPGRPASARAAMGEDRVLEIAPILSH